MFRRSAVLTSATLVFMGAAYADAPLTGPELKAFFSNSKMQYTSGDSVKHLEYKANGTAQQFNDDGSINKGKWKIQKINIAQSGRPGKVGSALVS